MNFQIGKPQLKYLLVSKYDCHFSSLLVVINTSKKFFWPLHTALTSDFWPIKYFLCTFSTFHGSLQLWLMILLIKVSSEDELDFNELLDFTPIISNHFHHLSNLKKLLNKLQSPKLIFEHSLQKKILSSI